MDGVLRVAGYYTRFLRCKSSIVPPIRGSLCRAGICHLRLRTGEALQSAAVLYGDPFLVFRVRRNSLHWRRRRSQPALRCSGEQYYSVSVPHRGY